MENHIHGPKILVIKRVEEGKDLTKVSPLLAISTGQLIITFYKIILWNAMKRFNSYKNKKSTANKGHLKINIFLWQCQY